MAEQEHSTELVIENPLGFHVRPIQRFAELARAFQCEIEVQIEGRSASGKSVMGLMSLGGRCGSKMEITCRGQDARQALQVLSYLVEHDFFVEDELDPDQYPHRHIDRLVTLACCFDSDILVLLDDMRVDARDADALRGADLQPTSEVQFEVQGGDGPQAEEVLAKLVKYQFYVEEAMSAQGGEKRG